GHSARVCARAQRAAGSAAMNAYNPDPPSGEPSAVVDEQQQGAPAKISPIEFLKTLFAHTEGQIYTCSFPNERDDEKQPGERHVISRKPAQITRFINKWDKPERGTFFGVGTLKEGGSRRAKDTIAETICLHADIDFKNVD